MNARIPSQVGVLNVLNVGAGDITLSFDNTNPAECIRAARIIKDMLRRGYAILIEVERNGRKAFERAVDFDEAVSSYIIADFAPAADEPITEGDDNGTGTEAAPAGKRGRGRIAAAKTRGVAVAPIAGG